MAEAGEAAAAVSEPAAAPPQSPLAGHPRRDYGDHVDEAEPALLRPDRTAPCLAAPSFAQGMKATANPLVQALPPPSPAAAAAAVLVDGPWPGPFGWTSVASQDGQVRIHATAAFLGAGPTLSTSASPPPPPPLMLAHVLRMAGPAGPGPLVAHAWGKPVSPSSPSYLGTLHRNVAVVHAVAADDPAQPPAPLATLRPCAEARCLDLLAIQAAGAGSEEAAAGDEDDEDEEEAPSTPPASPAPVEQPRRRRPSRRRRAAAPAALVALGGSFGLELHQVPRRLGASSNGDAGVAPPPTRLLPGASVAMLRFSPGDGGRHLAVACLDGRVGVLDAAALLGELQRKAAEMGDDEGEEEQQQEGADAPSSSLLSSLSSTSPRWACAVVCGERPTGLAFSHRGDEEEDQDAEGRGRRRRRLAVVSADGTVLMLRRSRRRAQPPATGWEPCPAFLCSLRAARTAAGAAAAAGATALLLADPGPTLPCWSAVAWSPDDRYLAVSLPGGGGLYPAEIAVLDADSGARLRSLPLPCGIQGLCPVPAAAGGGGGGGGAGFFIQCIDEAGAFRAFRWELREDQQQGEQESLLALATGTATVHCLRDRGDGLLRLRWARGSESVVDLSAPFLPADAVAPWALAADATERVVRARGRVVVAGDAGRRLGIVFPEAVYVARVGDKEEEGAEAEAAWSVVPAAPGARILAAAIAEEEGDENGAGRLLMVVAQAAQEEGREEKGEEVTLELRSLGPQAGGAEEAEQPVVRLPLALPENQASLGGCRGAWNVLLSAARRSSSDHAAGAGGALPFVVVLASSRGDGGLCLWQGALAPRQAGAGAVQVSPAAITVELPSLALSPRLVPVALRTRQGRRALRFREEEEKGGPSRTWVLELPEETQVDEVEESEEDERYAWRVASVSAKLVGPRAGRSSSQ